MKPTVYTCFRYPTLDIGGAKGTTHIRFERGVYVATTKEEADQIEKNDWYGSLIRKRQGADELEAVRLAQGALDQGMQAIKGARGTRAANQPKPEPEEEPEHETPKRGRNVRGQYQKIGEKRAEATGPTKEQVQDIANVVASKLASEQRKDVGLTKEDVASVVRAELASKQKPGIFETLGITRRRAIPS